MKIISPLLILFLSGTAYAQQSNADLSSEIPKGIVLYKSENKARVLKGYSLRKEKDGSYSVYNARKKQTTGTINCDCSGTETNPNLDRLLEVFSSSEGSKTIRCIPNGCSCRMSVIVAPRKDTK